MKKHLALQTGHKEMPQLVQTGSLNTQVGFQLLCAQAPFSSTATCFCNNPSTYTSYKNDIDYLVLPLNLAYSTT